MNEITNPSANLYYHHSTTTPTIHPSTTSPGHDHHHHHHHLSVSWEPTCLCRYGTSAGGSTSVTGSGAGGGMSVSNSGSGANGVGAGSNSTSVSSSVAAQFGNSFGGASTASKLAAVVAAQQQNNSNSTPISSTAFDRYVLLLCGVSCFSRNNCLHTHHGRFNCFLILNLSFCMLLIIQSSGSGGTGYFSFLVMDLFCYLLCYRRTRGKEPFSLRSEDTTLLSNSKAQQGQIDD